METIKERQRRQRVQGHDKTIKKLRKIGVLKELGVVTKRTAKPRITKSTPLMAYLSDGGSILPNRFACWEYPFHQVELEDN